MWVAVSNQPETLTALELFFRHTRRSKMHTHTFNFRRISLSTIGKGLDSDQFFVFICICIHDKFCIALFKFATVIWIIICNVDDCCIVLVLIFCSVDDCCFFVVWYWYLWTGGSGARADPAKPTLKEYIPWISFYMGPFCGVWLCGRPRCPAEPFFRKL